MPFRVSLKLDSCTILHSQIGFGTSISLCTGAPLMFKWLTMNPDPSRRLYFWPEWGVLGSRSRNVCVYFYSRSNVHLYVHFVCVWYHFCFEIGFHSAQRRGAVWRARTRWSRFISFRQWRKCDVFEVQLWRRPTTNERKFFSARGHAVYSSRARACISLTCFLDRTCSFLLSFFERMS